MSRLLIIISLFLIISCNSEKFFFKNYPIYFMGPDMLNIQVIKGDTILEYKSISIKPSDELSTLRNQKKIIDFEKLGSNHYLIKSKKINGDNIYDIEILKLNNKGIEFKFSRSNLAEKQINNYNIDTIDYKNAYGVQTYNKRAIKSFQRYKRIKTQKDIDLIENEIKTNSIRYKNIAENFYEKYLGTDIYNSILTSIIHNEACFQTGYNPVDFRFIKNVFKSPKLSQKEKEEKIEYYYKNINQ